MIINNCYTKSVLSIVNTLYCYTKSVTIIICPASNHPSRQEVAGPLSLHLHLLLAAAAGSLLFMINRSTLAL